MGQTPPDLIGFIKKDLISVERRSVQIECAQFGLKCNFETLEFKSRNGMPAQPVVATPSAINLISKGGVYDARETGKAFRKPADRHVVPLEGGTVVA
jgi:hypothetical protein